ncbi:hypothetical protein PPL_03446 [Heterostelium album PN500]|uniref:Ribosomal protein/NADH dehydrogenase domain-containing protein n=1 Tax=Heterostelium pallidum (strain ATCC 26659 / Pp 5 / PN500) TaxID=670386 RepID=D3B4X0_HETP5|nr:hypothetical protein PPL_03446 [Heterostelium album PN500]EFA84368.1 hypothetical protein PPL_03446 [Heterostelium album PN500]|eukprot:XP_020436483.1 hypothetical protein PPL_03446 [Heterostelium album PN500]
MQRFYKVLDLPKPKQYSALYKAYCMQKIYLYNTEKITFITSKYGKDVTGSRMFKYTYLEPFKYWNSDVQFEEKKMISGEPGVEIKKVDGTVHFIAGRGKTADQLITEVLEKADGKKINVNIPDY